MRLRTFALLPDGGILGKAHRPLQMVYGSLRRDEGIAPYAEFSLGRSNDTLMRRAGSPDPAAGTSILLQL